MFIPGFVQGRDRILDFDMDAVGRCVAVLQTGSTRRLATQHGDCPLPADAAARISEARLLPDGKVLVGPVVEITDEPIDAYAVVSADSYISAALGVPQRIFASGAVVFSTYGERTMLFVRAPSFETDIVTVFDGLSQQRLFGLTDILARSRDQPDAYEVTSGCAHGDEFTFVALGSRRLWTLDVATRTYCAVSPTYEFEDPDEIEALAVCGVDAVLMFTREDGLDLVWIDRRDGSCSRREHVPRKVLVDHLGCYASPKAGSGWALDAAARGLGDGRFTLRTVERVVLLESSQFGTG